jgi:tripartite-type tricarboxylate transporter receptor subunit TctC
MGTGKKICTILAICLCAAAPLAALAGSVFAAEDPAKFPSKPITMIVQFGPGGSTDTSGRKLAELAGKALGQPVIIENRPGGAGITAFTGVAKAAPDGYTIGTVAGPIVMVPHQRTVPFNPKEDFSWIMQFLEYTQGLAVRTDSRFKTYKELVEEARKNPNKVVIAHMGPKGLTHVILEQLAAADKVKFGYVATNSGSEAIAMLLGGHVDALMSSELVHVRAGKIRVLGIHLDERYDGLPGVPTFAEMGYKVEAPNWCGVFAPKGVDPRILKKLNDGFRKAFDDPSFKEACNTLMLKASYKDGEAFRKMVFREYDAQAVLMKKLGFAK